MDAHTDTEIARINKGKDELHVAVKTYEGHRFIDIRTYFENRESAELLPTRKGVTISPKKLPELIAALQEAQKLAAETEPQA